ncbi:uncharacterized protein LOC111056028 [Nilaparvata lugens]|uniref:uncharacterized protein LOC111056028 n=1 Tax=Nilaparvata lugens TaxID=108931 RepID=UPI00193CD3F3|nr:uncharacterized protein LOC111056028 [Nilaparvata lugens]
MTCEAFFEFVADIFYPWLKKENIPLPVALFVDGHSSHLSLQVSQFCEKNGIILIALYPNATHLLQPMDVSVFRTLKEHWKRKVHEWRLSNLEAPILKKKDFPKLLKQVIDNVLQVTILENGFRKCGLFPWNPEAITLPLNIEGENQVTKAKKRSQFLKEGLRFLNESIPESKLKIFCNSSTSNELEEKDISLFELWQKTKLELESNLLNASGPTNEGANLSTVDGDLSSATLTPDATNEGANPNTVDGDLSSATLTPDATTNEGANPSTVDGDLTSATLTPDATNEGANPSTVDGELSSATLTPGAINDCID